MSRTRTINVRVREERKQSTEEKEEIIPYHLQYSNRQAQPRPRLTWAEDTVDNEHLNKKSSKSKI